MKRESAPPRPSPTTQPRISGRIACRILLSPLSRNVERASSSRAPHRFRRLALALAVAALLAAPAARADEASLQAEIAELRAQIAEMKAQMRELAAQAKAASAPATSAATPAVAAPGMPAVAAAATPAPGQPGSTAPPAQAALTARVDRLEQTVAAQAETNSETGLFGYGEITYNHPTHSSEPDQASLAHCGPGMDAPLR